VPRASPGQEGKPGRLCCTDLGGGAGAGTKGVSQGSHKRCCRRVAGVLQGCYGGVQDPQVGAEVAPGGVEEVTVGEVRQLPGHLG
jgi:hypothetical protein